MTPITKAFRRFSSGHFVKGEEVDPFAAFALGHLAKDGTQPNAQLRGRFKKAVEKDHNTFRANCLLQMSPDDKQTVELAVTCLRYSHSIFEEAGIREMDRTLQNALHHAHVRDTLVNEIELVIDEDEQESEYHRAHWQEPPRLRAAHILVSADTEMAAAMTCLEELTQSESSWIAGQTADALGNCSSHRTQAIKILIKLLKNDERYVVDGDFYGNGGESRIVAERAALALAKLRAREALQSQLTNQNFAARLHAVRALRHFDQSIVTDQLLKLTTDLEYRVRLAAVKALGSIGSKYKSSRPQITSLLKSVTKNDRRRTVRDTAKRVIRNWSK